MEKGRNGKKTEKGLSWLRLRSAKSIFRSVHLAIGRFNGTDMDSRLVICAACKRAHLSLSDSQNDLCRACMEGISTNPPPRLRTPSEMDTGTFEKLTLLHTLWGVKHPRRSRNDLRDLSEPSMRRSARLNAEGAERGEDTDSRQVEPWEEKKRRVEEITKSTKTFLTTVKVNLLPTLCWYGCSCLRLDYVYDTME